MVCAGRFANTRQTAFYYRARTDPATRATVLAAALRESRVLLRGPDWKRRAAVQRRASFPPSQSIILCQAAPFYIKCPLAAAIHSPRSQKHSRSLPRYFIPRPRFSSVAIRRCARDNGRSAAPSPSTTSTWSPPAGAGRSPRTPLFS
jgi:hypothetical protein